MQSRQLGQDLLALPLLLAAVPQALSNGLCQLAHTDSSSPLDTVYKYFFKLYTDY